MKEQIVKQIAELIKQKGGRAFYVGGYVRDKLLGLDNKDIDIEVHGLSEEDLLSILEEFGFPMKIGKTFGIYSIRKYNLDIALPRTERKTGNKHQDFDITIDPFVGYENACKRRDFTINALMEDVLTGEIIDYFNGQKDLENKIIRHIKDEIFIEDPLRVLRACQFASRFSFKIANETIELCKKIDLKYLSKERVEEELKKALLKGEKPSIFFEYLKQMNQLDYWFKEIKDLIDVKQDLIYHPEGDAYVHTMQVLDNCAIYKEICEKPYYFMMSSLCHDLGKAVTTKEINGRIHAYEHEIKGIPIIDNFIKRISTNKELRKYVKNLALLHMKPTLYYRNKSSIKSTNKLFDEALYKKDLIYLSLADNRKRRSDEELEEIKKFLFERLDIYNEYMSRPYVTGDDLLKVGIVANEDFKYYLEYAHKLRLAGVNKQSALKSVQQYKIKK